MLRTRSSLQDRSSSNHARDGGDANQASLNTDPLNAEPIQCPVCLNNITYPVVTNCDHTFCAECVLAYWRADRWPRACRCPVCRREVTLLLTDRRLDQRYEQLWEQVRDYNQRMSGEWRPVSGILCVLEEVGHAS